MEIPMDLMHIIKERRSVRNFTEQEIPEALLELLLEAVRWSPSWANTQCWEVIAVKETEIKEKLQTTIVPKNPATKAILAAPVLLAFCGKKKSSGYYNQVAATKFGDWMMFDLGIAVQSLCLTAHAHGLGSVIVGLFDHDAAGKILQVPDGYETVVLVPLGYPNKIPSAPKRKEITEFTHHELF